MANNKLKIVANFTNHVSGFDRLGAKVYLENNRQHLISNKTGDLANSCLAKYPNVDELLYIDLVDGDEPVSRALFKDRTKTRKPKIVLDRNTRAKYRVFETTYGWKIARETGRNFLTQPLLVPLLPERLDNPLIRILLAGPLEVVVFILRLPVFVILSAVSLFRNIRVTPIIVQEPEIANVEVGDDNDG